MHTVTNILPSAREIPGPTRLPVAPGRPLGLPTVRDAMRAGLAVVSLVALAQWLDRPILSWAAFGAFWTCLADPGGRDRRRFGAMSGFALAGTVIVVLGAAVAGEGPVPAGAVVLLVGFLTGVSGTLGPAAAQVGGLIAVVSVVAVAFPKPLTGALALAGSFLSGAALTLLLDSRIVGAAFRVTSTEEGRHALRAGLRTLRRLLVTPVPPAVLQHALRLAVAVTLSYALATKLGLAFAYWATISTVVVLQPQFQATFRRSVARMLGSTVGGLLAALLLAIAPAVPVRLALIFLVATATIACRRQHYAVFVVAVSTLFVLVTDLLQPGTGIPLARAVNSILGSAIGAAVALLHWPTPAPRADLKN